MFPNGQEEEGALAVPDGRPLPQTPISQSQPFLCPNGPITRVPEPPPDAPRRARLPPRAAVPGVRRAQVRGPAARAEPLL